MKHYSELSPLEKKAREASGRLKCTDCPIYKLCKTSEMFIDACDFIYLSAFKTGYNNRDVLELEKKRDKYRNESENSN